MSNNGSTQRNILWYNQLGMNDVPLVGGKNASLGEMITHLSALGVSVPNGFATTAQAFNDFLEHSGINQRIYRLMDNTNIDDIAQLASAGAQIRQWIIDTPFSAEFEHSIHQAYQQLVEGEPDASFAGQQETFLNVQGIDAVMIAIKHVFASLFNDRAISYRVHQGYQHRGVALSAGVQRMVYAPTQEHSKQVRIEEVPQEQRNHFSLNDNDVEALAHQALLIERHYGRPMDIEWAKDGHSGKLYIVQARPETVRANKQVMERYQLNTQGEVLVEGRAIGQRIGAGPIKVIHNISEMDRIQPGDVLVTDMTDPDWEPIMKKAAAIVTNRGGRTCHAAIMTLLTK